LVALLSAANFPIGELAVKLLHVAWIKSSMAGASLIDRNSTVSSAWRKGCQPRIIVFAREFRILKTQPTSYPTSGVGRKKGGQFLFSLR
jgi:hypothetical protein